MAKKTPAARSLKTYQSKRQFDKTPEPSGDAPAAKPAAGAPGGAFCVQKHLATALHYDFRLAHRGVLLSWAVPKGPSLNPADKRLAMMVEDHPLDYGDFEGVILEGYGQGIVVLWDRGTWQPEPGWEDVDAALAKGELKFRLEGSKLKGSWVLVRTKGWPGGGAEGKSWLLFKHKDEWAGAVDIATAQPRSVKTGRDFAEILAAESADVLGPDAPKGAGAAAKLLREIIQEAARIRAGKEKEH